MNPGLVVKLRPSGPWRIGPDSGARNRVDVIYHSDSLFSAVTSAMSRMGRLDEWLDATARGAAPAVCFGSCFPFVEEIGFVVPPRTVWPPASPALMAAHVRWKSARFIPLGMVQAILSGEPLDENQWSVDGPSGCLVPVGRAGPFRTSVRWGAAVDRLSGASERHSTACIEFRPGAGLWTVIGFADEVARDQWQDTLKACFRLLADTGFGGERSRGWGRSEAPEFIEGELPSMIVKDGGPKNGGRGPGGVPASAGRGQGAEPPLDAAALGTGETQEELTVEPEQQVESEPAQEAAPPAPGPWPLAPAPGPLVPSRRSHWLLSLFAPAASDAVDWSRGNYTVLARGGRVDSPAGSGELKKQVQMVAEGSVLVADAAPRGAAPDVAPDGFAHPVFRAGFALAIPLPEGY